MINSGWPYKLESIELHSGEETPEYMSISEAVSGKAPLVRMEPRPDYGMEEGLMNTAFEQDDTDVLELGTQEAIPTGGHNIYTPTRRHPSGDARVSPNTPTTTNPADATTADAGGGGAFSAQRETRFEGGGPGSIATTERSSISSIVDMSMDSSVERRARNGPVQSKDELLYRMSMAHLAPKGVNWGDEMNKATETQEESEIPTQVLNSLRDFPMSMSEKLALNSYIRNEPNGRYSQFGFHMPKRSMTLGQGKHSMARGQKAVSDIVYSDTFGTLGFWDAPIARITALLGTNVASYFKFLRFLAVLNSWSAIIMFCFVILPQIIPGNLLNNDLQRGFFGKLSQTIFFYGAYNNNSISASGTALQYDRPLAYFLTWCSLYILSVLFIVMIMFTTYRRSKQTFGDTRDRYSAALLMGWDHSVTHQEGCRLKASALTTYFREMKLEDTEKNKLSRCDKCTLLLVRAWCTFLCIAIMGGSGYLIYYVADVSMDYVKLEPSNFKDFFRKYQLTVAVSALKLFIPPVLGLLLYFEKYQPRTAIKIQLARTAVFYGASLMSFLISIYTMSTQCEGPSNPTASTSYTNTLANKTLITIAKTPPKKVEYCCWENAVGEQLFQVVILDLLVNVGVGLLLMAGRALVVNQCFRFRMMGYAEFNVAAEILDLVYGQALIWLGLYAAPFLALVGVIKLILQFYFFYNMAAHFCDPPTSIFRASRSGGFFRFVLLVALFICMFPLTYMIVSLEPSTSCGPFQTNERVYEVFTETIGDSPDWLRTVLYYVSTPAVVIPVIVILVLLVLYYRVKSSTQRKTAKRIRVQFKMKRQLEKKQLFSKNRLQRGMSRYHRV